MSLNRGPCAGKNTCKAYDQTKNLTSSGLHKMFGDFLCFDPDTVIKLFFGHLHYTLTSIRDILNVQSKILWSGQWSVMTYRKSE